MTRTYADGIEDAVTLAECPPGPFLFNGSLGFKTEYGAMRTVGSTNVPGSEIRWAVSNYPDAYCMDSGEYFWGGTTTHEARAKLMVQPIRTLSTSPSGIEDASRLAEVLADPIAVHLNMLRGGIAKPSIRNIIHLYGEEALRDALPKPSEEASDAIAMRGWRPIESAPKDGRELLLYGVCWDKRMRGKYAPDQNIGWFTGNGEWTTRSLVEGITPTHWMPLPAPPLCESASSKIGGDHG